MADFIFNVKGLTAKDRAQWEKDNIEELNKLGYYDWDNSLRDRYFRNRSFKNKFGDREDFDSLKLMTPEKRDSLFLASPDSSIEDLQSYQTVKDNSLQSINESRANDGKLIGSSRKQWEDFDKMLDQVSPYYKRFKGTEYFPLNDDNKKVDLMSTFQADVETLGQDIATKKMADRIKTEVSENQPLLDKIYNGFVGMGANIVGGTIGFVGNIVGGLQALTGVDRLFGENQKEGYWDNLWTQFIDNPLTRYGKQVMEQGTFFTEDDPEKAYNLSEVIRTAEEDSSLWSNIFSVNTIPELMQQSGFTIASMVEGQALSVLGNTVFNSMRAATMAKKAEATVEMAEKINKTLNNLTTWQRRYNAYAVPSFVGQAEGALNALDTKQTFLEDAQKMIDQEHLTRMEGEVQKRMQEALSKIPLTKLKEGQQSPDIKALETKIRNEVLEEYQPMYQDAVDRAERDADLAALSNFTINSFINGAANTILKAPMFGGKVTEALSRSKVGKLFSDNKFTTDAAGNIIAKEITWKGMTKNALKETLGEGLEEYTQDISDAFSRGGAENDLANYIEQRYSGISDEAITGSLFQDLGVAFAAAGKQAISKESIQSGLYGALGQALGTPNVNAIFSKGDRVSLEDKSTLGKIGAGIRNIYRNPIIESIYNDKAENEVRRESAKAMNEWLNQGNNREKLTTLKGSIGWAKQMQDAADEGDEFSFRNSRLGKLVSDYFMLERLQDTPLYDAYIQRYTDILSAQEGDETAQEIAKYDSRPLADIQKDAQNMLDIMEQVQEVSADLEKSLGSSIPQEVKETLIWGKLSMNDWKERATQLENDIQSIYTQGNMTSLTDEQKKYIARNGKVTNPSEEFDKEIAKLQVKKEALEKNKSILSDTQKQQLSNIDKQIKVLQKKQKQVSKEFQKLFENTEETPVLSKLDIMNLNPIDRYKMLNPKNRKNYSELQQNVLDSIEEEGTAKMSDFMNKIEDAARINDAQTSFLKQYNEALKNPNILTNIAKQIQFKNMYDDLQKSYKKIGEIEDYKEFAQTVDNTFREANDTQAAILHQTLKDNPMYQRYLKQEETIDNLYNQIIKNEHFKDLNQKDADLVAAITKFLSREGVDVSNYDQAVSILNSSDDSGQSNLTSYINEINKRLPEDNKISLNNIGQVVNNYQKALQSFKDNKATNDAINRPVEEKPISSENPPSSSIFDSAVSSLEESDAQLKQQQASEQGDQQKATLIPPQEEQGQQSQTPDAKQDLNPDLTVLTDEFINNNDDDQVLNYAQEAVDLANNVESIYDEDAKRAAIEAINSLGNAHYDSIEDLQKAIVNKAEELKNNAKEGGDINERTGALLQQISYTLNKEIDNKSKEGEQNKGQEEQKQQQGQQDSTQDTTQESTQIKLADIDENKTGFLSKKFKEWKVEDYIRSGKLLRGGKKGTDVFYVALDDITNGVKDSMSQGQKSYQEEEHLPVLAVVQDDNGPILIGNKRYQPIGVLPSTSKNAMSGKIRKLAAQTPNKLVSSGNKIVKSSVQVASPRFEISNTKEGDRDFLTLISNALTQEERQELEANPTDVFVKSRILNKYLKKIASRLRAHKDGKGKPTLYYVLPTMKGDNSETEITVQTKSLDETTNSDGISLLDAVQKGDDIHLINFNSRIRGFAKALQDLVKKDLSSLTSNGDEFTGGEAALKAIENIDKILNRYLYSSNASYSVRPSIGPKGLGLDLYLGNENLGNLVESIKDNTISNEKLAKIVRTLLMPNGSFREYLNWQVDKDENYYKEGTTYYSEKNIANLILDNILRLGINSLDREISGVYLDNPEALKDPVTSSSNTVVNSDNASPANGASIDSSNTQSGQQVNVDTGLTDSGNNVKNVITPEAEKAEKISKQIEQDSKDIKLSDDGKSYIDTKTGKTYARVTSIIQADEEAGERFDSSSPWVTPSTNIGTGIDEFIRDFFAGKFKDVTDNPSTWDVLLQYPNASGNMYNKLRNQLIKFKNQLDADGLHIIPRDVVVTGSLQITNKEGKLTELPIAGTLDLLAYDNNGNFYIFDMKTHHADTINDEKKAKYARQLSLYKQFLESKYGIKVKSLKIIPIKVDYPTPNNLNNYDVSSGNQLTLNGKEFKDSEPRLSAEKSNYTLDIKETNVKINYYKLTASEKALIDGVMPEGNIGSIGIKPEQSAQDDSNLNVPNRIRTRKKARGKNNNAPVKLGDNVLGTTFNELTTEQQKALKDKYKDIQDIEDYFNMLSEEEKKQELGCL